MKKLKPLFLLSLVAVTGCSQTYPSKLEAMQACFKWDANSDSFTYQLERGNSLKETIHKRSCRFESETNQWLGIEITNFASVKRKFNGKTYYSRDTMPKLGIKREVVRNFRF